MIGRGETMTVDKATLLEGRRGPRPYEIDGVGEVMIRPLSRGQTMVVQDVADSEERDNLIISMGLVDPALTVEEVQAWADGAPAGELARLGMEIARISGMIDGQQKEITKSAARRRR